MAQLVEQNRLKTREAFGRKTEKLSELLDSTPVEDEVDEAGTDSLPENISGADEAAATMPRARKHGKKTCGKRCKDLSGL